ncbi:NmrA-like family domain-containing protein 1 [Fusarium oxysporum f. sp. albedinis]|nr:NmrA-like family domain-containing protein 1 [Fusarium oxysporum f. sp. albedinis]
MDSTTQGDDAPMCRRKAWQPILSPRRQGSVRWTELDTEHGSGASHDQIRDRYRSPRAEMTTPLTYQLLKHIY